MPTKGDRERWSRFPDVGCVACRKDGRPNPNTQVHHLNLGGKAGQVRRGHRETIPLCPWHHQTIPPGHLTKAHARELLGPSLAEESRAFRARYGTDDELLRWTDELLGAA